MGRRGDLIPRRPIFRKPRAVGTWGFEVNAKGAKGTEDAKIDAEAQSRGEACLAQRRREGTPRTPRNAKDAKINAEAQRDTFPQSLNSSIPQSPNL